MALQEVFKHIEQTLREQAALAREESAALIRNREDESADAKDSEATLYIGKARQIRTLLEDTLSGLKAIDVEEPPVEFLRTAVYEPEIQSVEPLLIHGSTLTELTPDQYSVLKHTPQTPDQGMFSSQLAEFYLNHPELELFTREHVREITGHGAFASKTAKQLVDLAIKRGVAEPTHRSPWLYPKDVFEEICYYLGPVGLRARGGRRSRPTSIVEQPPADEGPPPQQPDTSLSSLPATIPAETESKEVSELSPAKILLMTNILLNPEARKITEDVFGESTAEEDLMKLHQMADKLSQKIKLPQDVDYLVLEIGEFLRYFQQNPDVVLKRYQGSDEGIIFTFFPIGEADHPEDLFLKMYEATQKGLPQPENPVNHQEEQLDIKPLTEYEIGVLAYYLNKKKVAISRKRGYTKPDIF